MIYFRAIKKRLIEIAARNRPTNANWSTNHKEKKNRRLFVFWKMLQRSDRKRITPLRQNKTARIKKHFELLILLLSFIVGFVHALTSFGSYWNQLPLVAPLNSDPSSEGWLLYYLLLLTPVIPVNTSLWTADGTKKENVYQGSSKDGI